MKITAAQSFKQIQERAEAINCGDTQHFPEAASIGDSIRQGDIYITLLEDVPEKVTSGKTQLQIAPGTTKGSRHILSHKRVEMFIRKNATALDGPVIKTKEEVTVTHPEHGDWVLPPGCYGVTYQRAFADELRRVLD